MTVREKGFANFLAKIAADPTNRMLRERLLALLAEVPDSPEKLAVVLDLARILLLHAPNQAMELAYSAYSFDDTDSEALKVVAACLRQLGRHGKAEVIENEIARFKESSSAPQFGTHNQAASRQTAAPLSASVFMLGSSTGTTHDAKDDSVMAIEGSAVASAIERSGTVVQAMPPEGEVVFTAAPEPASLLTLSLDDAEPAAAAPAETKVYGQPAAVKAIPDVVAELPSVNVSSDAQRVDAYGSELDALLAAGQARKALLLMRMALADHIDDMLLAKVIWQRLPLVWQILGLRGFVWTEASGPRALADLLQQRSSPKISALAPYSQDILPAASRKTPLVS